jgi:hypothetical protein
LALYSIVALDAQQLFATEKIYRRCAAWYPKPQATFSDTIAGVRRDLWSHAYFSCLAQRERHGKNPAPSGRSLYRLALLCRLNGQSRAKENTDQHVLIIRYIINMQCINKYYGVCPDAADLPRRSL